MSGIQVVVVTPELTVLDQKAEFAALPLVDGEIGVLPGHAPTIGRIGFGELRVRDGKSTVRYYVDGGFAQIEHNVVTLLTNRAIPIGQLQIDDVRRQLAEAEAGGGTTSRDMDRRQEAIQRARSQLRMLEKN